jgi:hypothetical protein
MRVVIDRFEDGYAICETEGKEMLNLERKRLPADAAEGDVLNIEGDMISIDFEETNKKKQEIEKLMDELWE